MNWATHSLDKLHYYNVFKIVSSATPTHYTPQTILSEIKEATDYKECHYFTYKQGRKRFTRNLILEMLEVKNKTKQKLAWMRSPTVQGAG